MSFLSINASIKSDLNMRVFETMACRTVLLTDDIPTVRELFEDGKHLVLYRTIDEAVELARGLIDDRNKREAISEAGYHEIISKHTYYHRACDILKTCLDYELKGEPLVTANL
jgi:spore maturation protein CgeB